MERKCQVTSREIQMFNKRQGIFENVTEGKVRVEDIVSERMEDKIIEEMKELVHRKTEEALQIAEKEHDLWMYQNEKEEAKRLQRVRKLRKDEEMAWPDWEEARKMASGGWSQKVKRKCRKSVSCRMRWKAFSWIWIAKARDAQ